MADKFETALAEAAKIAQETLDRGATHGQKAVYDALVAVATIYRVTEALKRSEADLIALEGAAHVIDDAAGALRDQAMKLVDEEWAE